MAALTLGNILSRVVRRCETVCDSDCCGLDAFDFHPIHAASAILAWGDRDRDETLALAEQELQEFEVESLQLPLDEFGCLGLCEQLNTSFTPDELRNWVSRMRSCLKAAAALLKFADSL